MPENAVKVDTQKQQLTNQLQNAIEQGHLAGVRHCLENIHDCNHIQQIESMFKAGCQYDPLILAIKCREEDIALYLVEKGFNHRLIYNFPGQQCDEWCYSEHMEDKCPTEFDALQLSQEKALCKLSRAIQDIRLGRRMPGDGLALSQNPRFKREDSSVSTTRLRSPSSADFVLATTEAMKSRQWARDIGLNFMSKTGDTLMHMCDTPSKVYACASLQVNINMPNFAGDSALHCAIRAGLHEVCEALLMCGADPTQKNKLGQTPLDGCCGSIQATCEKFKSGLLHAVQKGECNTIQRLVKLWCNPVSKITRDGRSAIDLAEERRDDSEQHTKMYNILNTHCKTLELTHAVLSEDIETVKRIVTAEKGWSLSNRFKDKYGATLASCAIEQGNLALLELLVKQDYCHCDLNVRVWDHQENTSQQEGKAKTIPMYFKTLEITCPDEIWSFVDYNVDCFQTGEKDSDGNTALSRAIINGKSAKFISRLIKRHGYICLVDRNMNGETPREVASRLNKEAIIDVIDQYISETSSSYFLSEFAVNFYGCEQLPEAVRCGRMQDGKYRLIEENGVALHRAAVKGAVKKVLSLNNANYKDKNGYTALTRAVVCGQYNVAEQLITERPVLKAIPDNYNRYPLHYAYALPHEKGELFIKLLLQKNPEDIEFKVDKDGRTAAEYKDLRNSEEMHQALLDVLSLDPFGKRISPVTPDYQSKSPESASRDST